MNYPRANINKRMVMVYHDRLGMFEVYKITQKGQVSKGFSPHTAYAENAQEAFRRIPVPFAGFKAVAGVEKGKYGTWNEYIEAVWDAAWSGDAIIERTIESDLPFPEINE